MDIFLPFKRCFSEGMTSMTAGLGGLQTAAFLSNRGDVTAHGYASRLRQRTGSSARIGGATEHVNNVALRNARPASLEQL